VYFLHIPKTAGTTFNRLLEGFFDPAVVCPAFLWHDLLPLLTDAKKYRLFRGHFYAGLERQVGMPLRVITFLREPIARCRSHYAHIFRDPTHYFHRRARELGNLAAFLGDPETGPVIWNCQTRALGMKLDVPRIAGRMNSADLEALALERLIETAMPEDGDGDRLLTNAMKTLEECPCFGITERFEPSLRAICREFGWAMPSAVPRLNQNPEAISPDEEEERLLSEANRLDLRLYESACQLFERRFASAVDPA